MAVCTTTSGLRASRASTSLVAVTPRVRPSPARVPGVLAHLVRIGHPQPDQLEVGSGVDAGDGVDADVSGAPGDDSIGLGHERAPRSGVVAAVSAWVYVRRSVQTSGRPMSRLGDSMPPSTSRIFPVMYEPASEAR